MSHPLRPVGRLGVLGLLALAVASATTPAQALTSPAAPTAVTVVPGKSQATISWTPGSDTAGSAPVTGYIATAILAGGVTGPTCTAPAPQTTCTITGIGGTVQFTVQATSDAGAGPSATSQQLVVTNQWAPPSPLNVQAEVGAKPGEAVVSWQAGTAGADQSAATSYLVTASPAKGPEFSSNHSCGYVDAPETRCTLTGLAPNTSYRFSVTAVSLSGESQPTSSTPLTIPGWKVTAPVQAVLCSGSELEPEGARRVRPKMVILDCYAYGPQYGPPVVRTIDGITWSTWTKTSATARGTLHWPTAIACTHGEPLDNCGSIPGDYPVTIQLRNPQPLNKSRSKFTFTEVGLFPTIAGPADCPTSCWIVPDREAYQ